MRSNRVEALLPALAQARAELTREQDSTLFARAPESSQMLGADGEFISDFLELAAISAEEALEAAQTASTEYAKPLAEKALELCTAAFGPFAEESIAAKALCERQARTCGTVPPNNQRDAAIALPTVHGDELLSWDDEIQAVIRQLSGPGAADRAEKAQRQYRIANTGPEDERLKARLWLEDFKKVVGYMSPSEAQRFENTVKVRTGAELEVALIEAFDKVIGHGEPKRLILEELHSKAPARFKVLNILGPCGNGKTTLATAVANALVGAENVHSLTLGTSEGAIRKSHDAIYTGSHPSFWAGALMRARGRVCAFVVNEPEKGSEYDQGLLANILSDNQPVRDHYFDFDLDFTNTWIICTLNDLNKLGPHLFNRLEANYIETYDLTGFGRREVVKHLASQHAKLHQASAVQLSEGAMAHVLARNTAAVGARKIERDCERLAKLRRAIVDSNARTKVLTREAAMRHTERKWSSERRSLSNTRSETRLGALISRPECTDENTITPWVFTALGRTWSFAIEPVECVGELTLLQGEACALDVKISDETGRAVDWRHQAAVFDVGLPLQMSFTGDVANVFASSQTYGLYVDKTEAIIGCRVELRQPAPLLF